VICSAWTNNVHTLQNANMRARFKTASKEWKRDANRVQKAKGKTLARDAREVCESNISSVREKLQVRMGTKPCPRPDGGEAGGRPAGEF